MGAMAKRPLLRCPTQLKLEPVPGGEALDARWVRVPRAVLRRGATGVIGLPGLARFLSLWRLDVYWVRPQYGRSAAAIPADTQMLLWERAGGGYGLLLPLVAGDLRASAAGHRRGVTLRFDGAAPGADIPKAGPMALVAAGDDPYRLVREGMRLVAAALRTFRPREDKPKPRFLDFFGWCTWDAFYHDVNEENVLAGLATWRDGGFTPGFMIVDDGWLDTAGDHLNGMGANRKKFPGGIAGLAARAKSEFGLALFGLWHCFQGYWYGINPAGPLAAEYPLLENFGHLRPWLGDRDVGGNLFLVHPDHSLRFFHELYRRLRAAGVDMVKVDGQSATELFCRGKVGRVGAMRQMQAAFQGAGAVAFGSELLHCMSHGTDVALLANFSNACRNSFDYLPRQPRPAQQYHVHMNAANALWVHTFAWPDWDMFQSHHDHSAFHAAARAVAGGPIYVSDQPGRQDFRLLRQLVWFDGGVAKTLACDGPGLPTRDCIFTDTYNEPVALKIFNRAGDAGVLGLFHCFAGETPVVAEFSAADVEGLAGDRFAVWSHARGMLGHVGPGTRGRHGPPGQRFKLRLGPMESAIVIFAPVHDGVAVLGLLDKLVAPAGVIGSRRDGNRLTVALRDGGRVGFAVGREPRRVWAGGRPAEWLFDATARLLVVKAPAGVPTTVDIELG